MHTDSPYWNWELGICSKHYLPQVPCPQCIATRDPDMTITYRDFYFDEDDYATAPANRTTAEDC